MENIDVSIIIPVYNAKDTLCRCFDSLLKQTYGNFEVIVIDDGSKDGSGAICDAYAAIDSRIKVTHKANAGVSAARQDGLNYAVGKYVIHVDPDDWVEPQMIEELYNKAVTDNSDMVICDFYENIGKVQRYHVQRPSSLDHIVVLKEMFQQLHGSCWNKLVKRVCYNEFSINFPSNIYYCEDLYVIVSLLQHNIKISYFNKAFYHYEQYNNKPTLIRYYDEKTYEHDLRLQKMFMELFVDDKELYQIVDVFFVKSIIGRAFSNGFNYYSSKMFKDRFNGYIDFVKQNFSGKDKIFLLGACNGCYRLMRQIKFMLQYIKSLMRLV